MAKKALSKSVSFRDPKASIDARVQDLIRQLTVKEKIGFLCHKTPGVKRLGISPYVWWNECLHGVGRAGRATVFPQAIGLAATFDPDLLKKIGDAIAAEARAKHNEARKIDNRLMYSGLTFWTPNINIFRDPRWGRGHETYGEDPHLTATLGNALVKGLQGEDKNALKVAACAKHYAVHSGPEPLRHVFDAQTSPYDLWNTYLPAFESLVVEAKVESVMGAYNRTNAHPCCAHPYLIKEILRGKWKFAGHFVSDCWAIEDFHKNHHITETEEQSAALALIEGCDVCCGCVYEKLDEALKQGLIEESHLDAALARALRTLVKLGIFDAKPKKPWAKLQNKDIHWDAHRKLSLQSARESIVLLKNDNNALPLGKDLRKIMVCGPTFDQIDVLLGNYNGLSDRMTTILEGIVGKVSAGTIIAEARGCKLVGPRGDKHGSINWHATDADVIIAVMGLSPRIEGEQGDAETEGGGDRTSIELPPCQQEYLEGLERTGKPIILVLTGGSAIAVPQAQDSRNVKAILQVFYPGASGGEAVADVLFGDYNPSGRLPFTVPMRTEDLPDFQDYSMRNRTYRYASREPLYAFGFGLSYSSFVYRELKLKEEKDSIVLSVSIKNTSRLAGDEVVQVYLVGPKQSGKPKHSLAAFERVTIKAKQATRVILRVPRKQFGEYDDAGNRVTIPGKWTISVGGGQPGFAQTIQKTVEI